MSISNQVVVVTGANGFVGRALCKELTHQGAIVRAMVREPSQCDDLRPFAQGGIYHFDLAGALDCKALKRPVRAMIHCAWMLQSDGANADAINVGGTRRLIEHCRRGGVEQFVFVSSLAAHEDARSGYGRSKWMIEDEMPKGYATIIKPGTIVGVGGVFARLRKLVRFLPAIPVFYANNRIQTVYIDDLVSAIVQSLEKRAKGVQIVASDEDVSIRDLYRGIARLEAKRRLMVPCYGDLALAFAVIARAFHLATRMSADNLLRIRNIRRFESRATAKTLNVIPRDYYASLMTLAKSEDPGVARDVHAEFQNLRMQKAAGR
jgi:nucleoside-diphosphate-sugar epimerase